MSMNEAFSNQDWSKADRNRDIAAQRREQRKRAGYAAAFKRWGYVA